MNPSAKSAIESLLFDYEKALNASDTKAVLKLYATDGVFMPTEAPTATGPAGLEQAYNFVFSQIKLNIKFQIDEIVVHGDLAYARTISRGKTDVLAAGITVPEENRELFVLVKEEGAWKIGRYMFNKMKPAEK
ncbi:MAG: SgcJ/EcaC family oxidoreductase [Lewinellaceae bacterium]|nr:SgcJ/EcaC family oxidoreductase [Saprospiraceae bacterium]MCB9336893.1 SgcJ/EcaC family oxidoreductase [Lewinellaceae bacterium]